MADLSQKEHVIEFEKDEQFVAFIESDLQDPRSDIKVLMYKDEPDQPDFRSSKDIPLLRIKTNGQFIIRHYWFNNPFEKKCGKLEIEHNPEEDINITLNEDFLKIFKNDDQVSKKT